MNSAVRIIKRDRGLPGPPLCQHEKTARQNEREIAGTIKKWIVELAQQRRADELTAHTRFLAAISFISAAE
jgi:protein subunit release factor B